MGFTIILLLVSASAAGASAAGTKVIKMTAQKYEFIPETIEVNLGDTVELEMTATDTDHGFGLSAFDIDRNIPEGETVRIEFVADKIPYVDSAWDAVHTFIRPVGGAVLGFMAVAGTDTGLQIAVALLTGAIAMNSHLTKSTARAALNTWPSAMPTTSRMVVTSCHRSARL